MKLQLLPLVSISLFIFQSNANAAVSSLLCRNEAHSAVTASVNFNENEMKLKFGSGADESSIEQDIKNKAVNLHIDRSASSEKWVEYRGEVLTSAVLRDYRTVSVRLQPAQLSSSKEFHTAFAISETHEKNGDPSVFMSYGMLCKTK